MRDTAAERGTEEYDHRSGKRIYVLQSYAAASLASKRTFFESKDVS
jgi:hypothetical protein